MKIFRESWFIKLKYHKSCVILRNFVIKMILISFFKFFMILTSNFRDSWNNFAKCDHICAWSCFFTKITIGNTNFGNQTAWISFRWFGLDLSWPFCLIKSSVSLICFLPHILINMLVIFIQMINSIYINNDEW